MQTAVPCVLWEITRILRGAIASVVVRPIIVIDIDQTNPNEIRFIDADDRIGTGRQSMFYETEAAAIADLEAAQ